MIETFRIEQDEEGMRIDRVLAGRYVEERSRTYFQSLIQDGYVKINGRGVKKQTRVFPGDQVEVSLILPPEIQLLPECIPLDIIFEDDQIIVVNKPAGLVVHPAPGHWSGTLVNALLHHCGTLPNPSTLRPGIVHRLDKGTSGLIIVAKTEKAMRSLITLFSGREIYKEYFAICIGNPGNGTVNLPIARHPRDRKKMAIREDGKFAVSHYTTLSTSSGLSSVKIVIETGRTHQIRVHLKAIGHPILGDSEYGDKGMNEKYRAHRPYLHAKRIRLPHPVDKKIMEFEASLPSDIDDVVIISSLG